jgi:hypothetical protein
MHTNDALTATRAHVQEDETVGGRLLVFRKEEAKCYPDTNNVTVADVSAWVDGYRYVMCTCLCIRYGCFFTVVGDLDSYMYLWV